MRWLNQAEMTCSWMDLLSLQRLLPRAAGCWAELQPGRPPYWAILILSVLLPLS